MTQWAIPTTGTDPMKNSGTTLAALGAGLLTLAAAPENHAQAGDWKEHTIAPVLNPVFFESPHIVSEVRPISMHQNIDKKFATGGGDLQLYAAEIRWAVSDRLAILATKDGYVDADLGALGGFSGFADLSIRANYAIIDDPENQFILSPGIELELPTGNKEVFQGSGKDEWDLFVSAARASATGT